MVRLTTIYGPKEVEPIAEKVGLALTRVTQDAHIAVTHIGTGLSIVHTHSHDEAFARRVLDAVVPLADWTLSGTHLANIDGLRNRVVSAVESLLREYSEDTEDDLDDEDDLEEENRRLRKRIAELERKLKVK
jgi:hypothetical protein